RFASPQIWDVAGGIALVRAGGRVVREHDGMQWRPMDRFADSSRLGAAPDLRAWRRPIVVGTKNGEETMFGKGEDTAEYALAQASIVGIESISGCPGKASWRNRKSRRRRAKSTTRTA